MLHDFLSEYRAELIDRCARKVARRTSPAATHSVMEHGIPLFLEQLIVTLRMEQAGATSQSHKVSGPPGGGTPVRSRIGIAAKRHARDLLQLGFTIDQVVHDYGDLCQAITEAAFEHGASIDVAEFQTLNRCLDNAIADAVTEFAYQREVLITGLGADVLNERMGVFAHELRNLLQTATLAFAAIKVGSMGLTGATGGVLDRSLIGLRQLVDRSVSDVRMTAGMTRSRLISVAELIEEVGAAMALEAKARGCGFTVSTVDPRLAVDADRNMLVAAVGNLVHNGFKFTQSGTEVALHAYAAADRVRIDIEDHCGGLPPNGVQRMFRPFTQIGADRSGLGLGLSICRRSVEANHGTIAVRDIPGTGCVFTIDLPRHAVP